MLQSGVISPRTILSLLRASMPRILTNPSPRTMPPTPVPSTSSDGLHLRPLQYSCTSLVHMPFCPVSGLCPPLPARVPCFLSGQALSRWSYSSRAASVPRGSPRGPGFPSSGLPGVSCVPLPAGVSPWRVVFSAFVISHARLRASSRTCDRPRASSGAGSPVVAGLWEQRVRLHGLGSV